MAHNESQGGWSQWQHQQHHHQHQQRSISSSVGALGRFALRALDLKNGPARIVITIFTLFFTRCSHPFTFTGRCLSYPILFFSSAPVSNRHLNIASTSLAFLFLSSFAPFFLSFSTFTTRISAACVCCGGVSLSDLVSTEVQLFSHEWTTLQCCPLSAPFLACWNTCTSTQTVPLRGIIIIISLIAQTHTNIRQESKTLRFPPLSLLCICHYCRQASKQHTS